MNSLFGKLKIWFAQQWLPLVCLLALAGLYIQAMNPDVAGFLYDDGMYLMSGQALWHGQGYSLPLIVGAPAFAKYPPLYPVVLGFLDWLSNRFAIEFPANIPWLKGFNILVSLVSLGLLYRWARRIANLPRWIALGAMLMIGTHWRWMLVGTELLSEPLFFLLTLLALMVTEGWNKGRGLGDAPAVDERNASYGGGAYETRNAPPISQLILLITFSTLAFYARSLGAVLILALTLWLWLRGERKQALIYAVACTLLALPWLLWSMLHPVPTGQIGNFLIRSFQETYFQSLRMDLRYEHTPWVLVSKGVSRLLGDFSIYFFPLLERLSLQTNRILTFFLPFLLSFVILAFLARIAWRSLRQHQINPAGIYVALYLLILPCWSFFDYYPRFVLMVLPFLLLFMLTALNKSGLSPQVRQWLIGGLLAGGVISHLIYDFPYIVKAHRNQLAFNTSLDIWEDCTAIFNFIRKETPPGSTLYVQAPDESYFYALNTGRSMEDFVLFLPKSQLKLEGLPPYQQLTYLQQQHVLYRATIFQLLTENRDNYYIETRYTITKNTANDRFIQLLPPGPFPIHFIPVTTSPHGLIQVYRIDSEGTEKPAG